MSKLKITLVMVARVNHEQLVRCLESVKGHVTGCFLLVDPGNYARALSILAEVFALQIPFSVKETEWKNISTNRNEAFTEARLQYPESDYYLVLDEDDYLP